MVIGGLNIFNDDIEAILIEIDIDRSYKKLSYIMGDYNLNHVNHDVHPNTASFVDTLYCKSFVPLQ